MILIYLSIEHKIHALVVKSFHIITSKIAQSGRINILNFLSINRLILIQGDINTLLLFFIKIKAEIY